ncbi:MAG: gliding motility-associated C-terminal domain-containing protein [Bacteroidetes bacterium]|nr:gliding motility-associated C-terminal domain-containing protein [Bacteroidota bacterium]
MISVTGASSGSTYNWTSIPGCAIPNTTTASSQNFDFVSCGAGSYPFAITVIDSLTSCVYNLNTSVNVVPNVVLAVTPDTTFCEGGTAVLYASGANTYLWSTTETTDTINVTGLTSAGSPYQYIVAGAVGTCTDTDTIGVTVNPIPVTGPISGPLNICENDTSTYYSVTPFGGNYTWSVTGGTIYTGQNTDSILVHWTGPGLGSITVVDTNTFGCAGVPQSISVTINPAPIAPTVFGSISVCEGATNTYFVNPNAGSLYYWGVTGGSYAVGQIGTVNSFVWGPAGAGSLTVYEVNAAGCFGPVTTYNVTINPRPLPVNVTGSSTVCDSINELYTVFANPGSLYTWSTVNSLSTYINATTDTLSVLWAPGTTGTLTVFETNVYGCLSDTTTYNVTVNTRPIASILPDSASVCGNTAFQLTASANAGTMHWISDGNGVFSDTLTLNPTYTPAIADSGYYHLTMILSNPPCADDTATMTLYVSPAPVFSLAATQASICWGQSDTLTATGNGSTISWTPGGDTTTTLIVNPTSTTTYTATVTNTIGCVSQDSITVVVIPPGIPDAGPDLSFCVGDTIILNGTQLNAGGILWTTSGDGVFDPANNVSPLSYLPGANDTTSGVVQIYLTTTGACVNLIDTLNIAIGQIPSIDAGADTTLTSGVGATVPLSPVATNAGGVIWTTSGSGTFSPSDTTLNATYTPSIGDFSLPEVYLTVTTTGGCVPAVDSLKLEFTPFVVPNVFTPYPASPGYNDYFEIKNLPPDSKLYIYNRWGELVYKSDSYRNNWDGYGLTSDTYWYVLATEQKEYHGWIQLLREEAK